MKKEYIDVVVKYTKEGNQLPLWVVWKDGRKFEIDKVMEITQAASLKVGGQGIRYRCRINGQNTYLWLENDRWFVEEK